MYSTLAYFFNPSKIYWENTGLNVDTNSLGGGGSLCNPLSCIFLTTSSVVYFNFQLNCSLTDVYSLKLL